jgi:hypothetical protein
LVGVVGGDGSSGVAPVTHTSLAVAGLGVMLKTLLAD